MILKHCRHVRRHSCNKLRQTWKQWAAIQVYKKAILFNHPSVLTYLHHCMSFLFLLCCSTAWIFQSVMCDVTWPCTKQKQGLQNSIFCVAVLLSFFLVIMNVQYLKISRRGGIQYIWRVCVWGGGERGIGFSNRKGGESKPTEQKECTSSASFCDITSLEYCKNLQQRTCFFFNC